MVGELNNTNFPSEMINKSQEEENHRNWNEHDLETVERTMMENDLRSITESTRPCPGLWGLQSYLTPWVTWPFWSQGYQPQAHLQIEMGNHYSTQTRFMRDFCSQMAKCSREQVFPLAPHQALHRLGRVACSLPTSGLSLSHTAFPADTPDSAFCTGTVPSFVHNMIKLAYCSLAQE